MYSIDVQLNYEFLRKCVAAAPVPPMATKTWEGIIRLLPRKLLHSSQVPQLREEILSKYEETIRKMTGKFKNLLTLHVEKVEI